MWEGIVLLIIIVALACDRWEIAVALIAAALAVWVHAMVRDREQFVADVGSGSPDEVTNMNDHIYGMEPHNDMAEHLYGPPQELTAPRELTADMLRDNDAMLHKAYGGAPVAFAADDSLTALGLIVGRRAKESMDIRSHWNNDNWKKYFENELGYFDQSNRDWWTNDDVETSAKHVLI
jgi:hypothetical protein